MGGVSRLNGLQFLGGYSIFISHQKRKSKLLILKAGTNTTRHFFLDFLTILISHHPYNNYISKITNNILSLLATRADKNKIGHYKTNINIEQYIFVYVCMSILECAEALRTVSSVLSNRYMAKNLPK